MFSPTDTAQALTLAHDLIDERVHDAATHRRPRSRRAAGTERRTAGRRLPTAAFRFLGPLN